MLVSLEWLGDYVDLKLSHEELALRFAMSGLNHESTSQVGEDVVLDLEVTSNRGDLLGHIGIAREAAVLQQLPLKLPELKSPVVEQRYAAASKSLAVENLMPESCPRYTARVIRDVKVGPSPEWLVKRLKAINIASINNVVDATNYVMMECGQPLHAFDYAKVRGQKIIVRPGKPGEKFIAIDHREYELNADTITIADAEGAIAIAGVMGGADSEITNATTDIVIESAIFRPLDVRRTARRLRLHSPSSYRFERRVDPAGVDWAGLRCCLLILEIAGGTLEPTSLETNVASIPNDRVTLRETQVSRVLGIDVPWNESIRILESLGCKLLSQSGAVRNQIAEFAIPSFRGDLPREIDLIEEIARIWGYDKLSETTIVPTVRSAKRDKDVLLERLRSVMVGSGFCEVLTPSCVKENLSQLMDVWPSGEPLKTITPMLEGASILRRSLVPSLLTARANNQSAHNLEASLFETASVYLTDTAGTNVKEHAMLGLVTGQEYRSVKGILEEMVYRTNANVKPEWKEWDNAAVDSGTGLQLFIDGKCIAWLGLLASSIRSKLKLNGTVAVAELDLGLLQSFLQILPKLQAINPHPIVERDLNFVLPESVLWKELTHVIDAVHEPLLREVQYKETYRDAKRDGEGKKRVLIGLALQSENQTLTTEQADAAVQKIIDAVESKSGGKLLGAGA